MAIFVYNGGIVKFFCTGVGLTIYTLVNKQKMCFPQNNTFFSYYKKVMMYPNSAD